MTTAAPAPAGTAARTLRDRLSRPSRTAVHRALVANLVGQVVIVVTGGAVRLTGSGLGCSTWPECEPGQFAPVRHAASTWNPFIEFGNRTLSGVLVVLAVAVAWAVLRSPGRPRSLRVLAFVPLAGVLVQAVIGGLSVLVDLHPAVVGTHFLVSMVLVAVSTALLAREAEPDGPTRPAAPERARTLAWVLVPLGALVLTLGVLVTGSGPHSGDEDTPYRLALDPVLIARVHAASVWAYVAVVVALVVVLHRPRAAGHEVPAAAWRATLVLLAVTLAQGLVGYVQYFTALPAVLVATHMLGASLLVVAQVRQWFSLRRRVPLAA